MDNITSYAQIREVIQYVLGSSVAISVQKGPIIEATVTPQTLVRIVGQLRENPQLSFRQLTDICGVDYPHRIERFEVVYHFLSLTNNIRLRLRLPLKEGDNAPSLTHLFRAANWWEREVYDMYGIQFDGHPDLRRILTDYEFEGYPLRKDFPLTGYKEVRYDATEGKVIYEPVVLPQAYRSFDFLSPWEGSVEQVLPGLEHMHKEIKDTHSDEHEKN